ncbi:MAG: glycosyltransferase family 39 protein [Caldilineales bacterium]|nr:glycosyltransferase family 39 protein [Caldilineales bacterium]MDW8318158.1 glycosyltransferase family 39 protein [Anaerolineae bacterium]
MTQPSPSPSPSDRADSSSNVASAPSGLGKVLSALGLLAALGLAVLSQAIASSAPLPGALAERGWLLALPAALAAAVLAASLAPPRRDGMGLWPPAGRDGAPATSTAVAAAAAPSPHPDESRSAASHVEGAAARPLAGAAKAPGRAEALLRGFGVALGIALAVLAQLAFLGVVGPAWDEGSRLGRGAGLLLVGMALFALAAPAPGAAFGRLAPLAAPAGQAWPRLLEPWGIAWLTASLAAAAFALGRFLRSGETSAVLAAWVVSLVAVALAGWRPARPALGRLRPSLADLPAPLVLTALLLVALVMRVYRLTTLPYDLDGDFASHGLQARALATGVETGLFRLGWANIPMLGFAPSALTMKLFGTGLAGLNMAGVVEGLLILVGVWWLGRMLFNQRVGLLAAGLLAAGYVHLHFSRTSEYIDPVFFLVYSVGFLVLGLSRGSGWAFALSGLCSAFAFLMYYSGRIVIFIVLFAVGYLLATDRARLWQRRQGLVLWAAALLVGLGPMLAVFAQDWEGFNERSQAVFLFYPPVIEHLQNKYGVATVSAIVWEQIKRTLLMFHYYHDTSTQFGLLKPFLDPYTATAFALGLAYALAHGRRFGLALLAGWTGLILAIGGVLTNNAPFWPRLLGLLPPTALLAAIAVDRVVEPILVQADRRGRRWAAPALAVALVAAVALLGWRNWNVYVEAKGSWATTRTRIGRYLADLPPGAAAYLVSTEYHYLDREFEFLAPGRLAASLPPEDVRAGALPADPNRPTVVVITAELADLLTALQAQFPAGRVQPWPDNDPGSVGFYTFTVPPTATAPPP